MRQRERDARRAFSPIAGRGVRGLRAWTRRYLPVSSRDALLCVVILSAAALLCFQCNLNDRELLDMIHRCRSFLLAADKRAG